MSQPCLHAIHLNTPKKEVLRCCFSSHKCLVFLHSALTIFICFRSGKPMNVASVRSPSTASSCFASIWPAMSRMRAAYLIATFVARYVSAGSWQLSNSRINFDWILNLMKTVIATVYRNWPDHDISQAILVCAKFLTWSDWYDRKHV